MFTPIKNDQTDPRNHAQHYGVPSSQLSKEEVEQKQSATVSQLWGIPAAIIQDLALQLTPLVTDIKQLQENHERSKKDLAFFRVLLLNEQQIATGYSHHQNLSHRIAEASKEITSLKAQVEAFEQAKKKAEVRNEKANQDFFNVHNKRHAPNKGGSKKSDLNEQLRVLTQERSRAGSLQKEAEKQLKRGQEELFTAQRKLTKLTQEKDGLSPNSTQPCRQGIDTLQSKIESAEFLCKVSAQKLDKLRESLATLADAFVQKNCKGDTEKARRIKGTIMYSPEALGDRGPGRHTLN